MELNFLLFRPPAKKWKVEELRGFHLWVPVEDSPALDKWIPKQNKAKFLPNIGDYLSAGDAKNSWDIEDQLESISIEEKNNIKGLIEQHSLDNSYNKPKFLKKKNSNNLIPAPQVLKVRMNFLGGVDANRNIHFYNKGSLTENELFSALENKYELNMIARGNFGYFPLSNLQKTIDDYHQLDESPHDESPYLRVDIEEEEWALSQAKSSRILEQWEIEESNVMVEDNSNSLLLGIEKLSSPPIKGLGNIKMEDNFQTDPLLSCNRAGEFSRRIPCLFIPEQRRNSNHFDKILVHFHGNAEDLMGIRDFATQLHTKLEISVLAVEYPGYGIYKGEATEERIQDDAEVVFQYVVEKLGYPSQQIIISGRSMGSGPSIHLASRHKIFALCLISPFASIKLVAEHLFGRIGALFLKERFNNLSKIADVNCPIFINHGRIDTLIPINHAVLLKSSLNYYSKMLQNLLA